MSNYGDQGSVAALKARIADIDAQVESLQAQASPIEHRVRALKVQIEGTDDALRVRGEVNSHVAEQRRRLFAALRAEDSPLAEIKRSIQELSAKRSLLSNDLVEAERPPATAAALQAELDAAVHRVNRLQSKRASIRASLDNTLERLMEIEIAVSDEEQAQIKLDKARSDRFLSLNRQKKGEPPIDAVGMASEALATASEKASDARACFPRLKKSADGQQLDLDKVDLQIKEAVAKVDGCQRACKVHAALRCYARASDDLRDGLEALSEADPKIGSRLREALRYEGMRTLDRNLRLIRPEWLERDIGRLM